jgi:hypothetical protein
VDACGPDSRPLYTGGVGAWYTIGLCLGLGLGFGIVLSGLLSANRIAVAIAALAGAVLGAAVGYAIGDVPEIVAGAAGGVIGALCAAAVAQGALRRGATRLGLGAYLGAAGVLVLLLALVPVLGYLATVALPALALRMRGRQAERYAGLRTLAK